MNGKIKRLVRERGFGFILCNEDGVEYFFHRSHIKNGRFEDLREEQRVEFTPTDSSKGPRTEEVMV